MQTVEFFGLFLFISGLILGLGAVTVIDVHGFLGRKSPYWTEATTRTHKVTKPLIWLGTFLTVIGASITYKNLGFSPFVLSQTAIFILLILNGMFLSFYVSPFLLKREREGNSSELLPKDLQNKITLSFIISFVGWWSTVLMLVYFLASY